MSTLLHTIFNFLINCVLLFSQQRTGLLTSEKPSGQFLGLIVMSHWLGEVWNRIRDSSVVLPSTFGLFRKSCLLVSWCAGGRCNMTCSDEDRGRSRRPGAEDQRWSHRSGTRWPGNQEVGWRCMRSAPCTWRRGARVSWLSLKTKANSLWVVWLQNHSNDFLRLVLKTSGDGFPGLGLKTSSYSLVIWASKPSRLRFIGCAIKPMEGGRRGTHVEI
jgi:hypothetical protein